MRKPASREITSASVELCETEVSCTSNFWHERVTSENTQNFSLMSTSSLQSLLQNQSLETILICNVVLCFPHDNIACNHMCDECKRSNELHFCHKLLSISLPHEQVCSQTIEYQVYQYVPNIDISEQFVSKLWTVLQLIHILLL